MCGRNLPWLIHESIKPLEIKRSLIFNLFFANKTIMPFLLFLDNWLIVLNSYSYCSNFTLTVELALPTIKPTNEENA